MARQYCLRCNKPQVACVCGFLAPQLNNLAVFILQHPDEKDKAIGTARLVELGLLRSQCITELTIPESSIMASLDKMGCTSPLLIYPTSLNDNTPHYVHDFEKDHSMAATLKNAYDSIILLDGSWRNTRELLHCNSWIKTLPTLQLDNAGESRYRIRQAAKKGALATIEAVAKVLALMDPNFQPEKLLYPFERMIAFQIKQMGLEVYQKNYIDKA